MTTSAKIPSGARAWSSRVANLLNFLRLRGEGGGDGCGESIPTVGFLGQAPAAGGGEFIKLGAAIVLRGAPIRFEQSLADQAEQAGIERALFNEQGIAGDLPDAQKDAVPVQWAERDGPEDEQIESARKKLSLVVHSAP